MKYIFAVTAIIFLSGCSTPEQPEEPSRPNIVFFLVDDMGWADLGCYGNTFHETPNIDRLAREGIRFTDAYASCAVCSPSRASIMTGKYPARLNITDWIPGVVYPHAPMKTPRIRYELPLEETTLAEALKASGYHTFHVGKWHLGQDSTHWPLDQGFDENIGGHSKGAPGSYFYPYAKVTPETDWTVQNLPSGGTEGEYLTDRLTSEAIRLIDKYKSSDAPFFLHMSYYTVHMPLEGIEEYVAKYQQKRDTLGVDFNPVYAAMIQSLDESVGRIVEHLESMEKLEETLIIFTSDNGGLVEVNGNDPLRAGKGYYYEGGIRVPLLIRLPGKKRQGAEESAVITGTDYFPTILDWCDISPTGKIDGVSFKAVLKEADAGIDREAVYWHYPHYHTPVRPPTGAVRAGNFKLLQFYEDSRVELYNLAVDIGEKNNLADSLPDKTKELQALLNTWFDEVKAFMPIPNPNYDPDDPFREGKAAWDGENELRY